MVKRLTRHGNSLALVIDKPLLDLLKITDKTELEIAVENGELIIRPTKKKKATKSERVVSERVRKAGKEVIKQYASVFKKLADS